MAGYRLEFQEHKHWDAESGARVNTNDRYAELQSIQVVVELDDYYRSRDVIGVTFYMHEGTGLITGDPVAFEAWLKGEHDG